MNGERFVSRRSVAFAVFLASVVGFMLVVTGLFALMRYLGGR